MTSEKFNKVVEEQLELCKNVLGVKAGEYADKTNDDRLHNFKIAAGLQGRDPKDALFGMLTKHLVSVRDMCYSGKSYDIDLWNEKITDSINYFLLLKGIVVEEYKEVDETTMAMKEKIEKLKIELSQKPYGDELLKSAPMGTYPGVSPEYFSQSGLASSGNPIPDKYNVTIAMNKGELK